jgi:hypothetical protein
MLDHISGGVGLQSERTKVVAEKAADCELGLLLIAGNRMSEVAGAVGHRSELPFAELFDSRQVDIDEIRIAAVEAALCRPTPPRMWSSIITAVGIRAAGSV